MRASCAAAWLLLCGVVAGCVAPPAPSLPAAIRHDPAGEFPRGWSEFRLPGKQATRYAMRQDEGRSVVRAESVASASMLRRKLRREPREFESVRFSWRVNQLIPRADLTDRDLADSPVRVVLAFDGDHGRLSPRNRMMFDLAQVLTGEAPPYASLMYVWDNKAPRESVIHGGRSDRVRKIVLEVGRQHLGQWRHYERDIVADFRRAFGEDPGALISVALMTDSDNTQSSAEAWYGDVQIVPPRSSAP